jgi:DegV family protein with EDD domain
MSRVTVVTDTTAYLPAELVQANQIQLVSLYVNFAGERTMREADITDYGEFFAELRDAEALPTTSQPAVGDFLAVYEPLVEQGHDVLSVHISARLSGTCDAARQAVETLDRSGREGRVRVFDSSTGAGGIGLVALAAAKAAQKGADLEAVEQAARDAREQLKIWFAIDTLEYLRRGGRIGAASAWIGSTLKIKPILAIESEIVPIERVRTWGRAFERLVDHLSALREDGNDRFFIQHIQAPEQAEKLAQRGEAIFGRPPEFVSEMGPVIGAHAGPGLIGTTALRHDVLGPV